MSVCDLESSLSSIIMTDLENPTPSILLENATKSILLQKQYSVNYQPVTLSWLNINVHVQPPRKLIDNCRKNTAINEPKQILKNVSGCVKPGSLLAIMAASGAGKSTLLNVLNQRNVEGLHIEGTIEVNGQKLNRNSFTALSAYVQQDDMFIGLLTVREHIWFQSMLRIAGHVSNSIREERANEVIHELGLTACADALIGAPGIKKSISGGEKKRLAFASEILTNPPLLFCDEPTSGLDSFMAESLVQTMKNLAMRGKTIISTIHQPSSEVYALFDTLLLLAGGRVAYMGPSEDAAPFFQSVGYMCPPAYNPADFFIHTLAIARGKETDCKDRIKIICDTFIASEEFMEMEKEIKFLSLHPSSMGLDRQIDDNASPYKTPWKKQFSAVQWRSWTTMIRQPITTRIRLIQNVFVALLFGLIFFNQAYDQKSIMNINGLLFLLQTQVSFGSVFAIINTFPLEFPVFVREHHNGMYMTAVYYMSKMLAELPLAVIIPTLTTAIVYWMVGLNPDPSAFLILTGVLILTGLVAMALGYIIGCSTSNPTLATTAMPTVFVPFMLFGGFFLNSESVPSYLIWVQHLSWFNYANEILVVNQWSTIENITCEYVTEQMSAQVAAAASSRCVKLGTQVIEKFSFSEDNLTTDVMALVALMVGFRMISFGILLLRSYRRH